MLRKDRVFEYVSERIDQGAKWVTIKEVSEALDIWRNDASVELNGLVSEGRLVRSGKKDVHFYLPEETGKAPDEKADLSQRAAASKDSCAFSRLVGANTSLKHQIIIAKAAVSYPPSGLNMLITGSTGTGKSKFAKTVWEYACEINAFESENGRIPYVHFNCAEYADNPQLLLSNLFGYAKGAFTGAVCDTPGLVEEANGGILFLDEIHCLSSAGQELFFSLLDTGYFRRIGDRVKRQTRFMLIGATTKTISQALLDTFVRRMPVLIQLPGLSERPLSEREDFIRYFYTQEACHLDRDVRISADVINALMGHIPKINIGTLKNIIQISCAKALLREGARSEGTLYVELPDLIFQIYSIDENSEGPSLSDENYSSKDMYIDVSGVENVENETLQMADIYDFTVRAMEEGKKDGLSGRELTRMAALRLDGYFEELDRSVSEENIPAAQRLISPSIMPVATELTGLASIELKNSYGSRTPLFLGMHLNQYVDRARSGNPMLLPNINDLASGYTKETGFLKSHRKWMEKSLGVPVTDDEIIFLAIFLRQVAQRDIAPDVCITLCSCTEFSASSIGGHISAVYGARHIHGIDNNFGDTAADIFRRICTNIKKYHGSKGNLLFIDFRPDPNTEEDIFKETGVRTRIIPVLEFHLVEMACRMSMMYKLSPDDMYDRMICEHKKQLKNMYKYAGSAPEAQENEERVIFTICVTGEGSAESIKKILEKELSRKIPVKIKAVSSLSDVAQMAEEYGMALKLIVGTVNPHIAGVPFFSADRVFSEKGLNSILMVLTDWQLSFDWESPPDTAEKSDETEQLIADNFASLAPHVDPASGMKSINDFMNTLEKQMYGRRIEKDARTRIIMHAIGMLERINTDSQLAMTEEGPEIIENNREWYELTDRILKDSFGGNGFAVPEAEVFYFMITLPGIDEGTKGLL